MSEPDDMGIRCPGCKEYNAQKADLAQKDAVINGMITGQSNLFHENEGLDELNRTLIDAARDDCENVAKLRAELMTITIYKEQLAKLRALCAARPKQKDYALRENWTTAMDGWCVAVDAAGRGEGEK
jgi:hypothetical protein